MIVLVCPDFFNTFSLAVKYAVLLLLIEKLATTLGRKNSLVWEQIFPRGGDSDRLSAFYTM